MRPRSIHHTAAHIATATIVRSVTDRGGTRAAARRGRGAAGLGCGAASSLTAAATAHDVDSVAVDDETAIRTVGNVARISIARVPPQTSDAP
jgi:hypothetical protein